MRVLKSPFALIFSALTALAVVAGPGTASPAQAYPGEIRVESPWPGKTLPGGSMAEQFFLDTSGVEAGSVYEFMLECRNDWGYTTLDSIRFESNGATVPVTAAEELPQSGTCSATLSRIADDGASYSMGWLGTWDVVRQLSLTEVKASASYFYPRVRDGWRDNLDVSWQVLNEDTPREVDVRVLNSSGTVVRTGSSSSYEWRWDGRYNSGTMAPAGNYRIVVSLPEPTPGAQPQEVTVPVAVRTDVVALRKTLTKLGHQSSVAATRSCQAVRDPDWDKNTSLDCWGGKYALARYRFTIPSNAYLVTWGLRNVTTGADVCCSGKITKSGVRSSTRTTFTVTGKVTGWRAMDIRKASVTYTAQTRR